MMTNTLSQKAAKQFAQDWAGKGYEKGDTQKFWLELLQNVLGVQDVFKFIEFEDQVLVENTNFMDGYIPATKVLIEQKSIEKELGKPVVQSDGSLLNPFQQAKKYIVGLPVSKHPRWVVTCNFREIWVYDMEQPNGEPQKILLQNLEKEYYRLQFLVDEGNEHLKREMEVSVKAGELVGIIYDKLLEQYTLGTRSSSPASEINADETSALQADILRSLNILCVRLVFCLYAEDSGLFQSKTAFHDYLAQFQPKHIRKALIDLFEVLDTPLNERDPYLDEDLAAFPYVNGGLFGARSSSPAISNTQSNNADGDVRAPSDHVIIPQFTDELKQLLLEKASADFDWSEISPTIFGAVFESTLNPETRRSGGMHYTSIENIHKVIDPLFMNDLKAEFEGILGMRSSSPAASQQMRTGTSALQVRQRLLAFQEKLASLTFFDPACGSGNFLTETFLSLRRLENEVIQAMYGDARQFDFGGTIKVNISQFYGIEINDFACTVAKTALWIAESQMLKETSHIVGVDLNFLPLKTNAYIHEDNALRIDWASLFRPSTDITSTEKTEKAENNSVSSASSVDNIHYPDYIIGNPPFVGARWMSKEQKQDVIDIFGAKWSGVGDLDYVCCWYKKSVELMRAAQEKSPTKSIRAALVSTNSITQGGAVANLWKPLMQEYNVVIDFAYRTFRWDSEADIKAHVHCVIIGFSLKDTIGIPKGYEKRIYLSDNQVVTAMNINGYLLDAPNIYIEKRIHPLCNAPEICLGGQPIDDGNFILTEEEKNELLRKEPQAEPLIRPFMMGKDFINRKPRYCLWLVRADPALLRQCKEVMERVRRVREFRLQSNRSSTLKSAETPTLFGAPFECKTNYIALPKVSSENRRYIPMDYLTPDIIPGDKLFCMQGASLYHFGVMMSNVHMAWMRTTCGRLKSDYSYSNTIVYNNFPWPHAVRDLLGTRSSSPANIVVEREEIEHRLRIMADGDTRVPNTAQAILDARAKYPDASLADLYDENAMPPELRKAHQDNDRAVMAAYGFSPKMTESECVAELFKRYQVLSAMYG